MNEKIMIEFTGEEMDKILEYQRELQSFSEDFLKQFPNKMETVQEAIMNAIQCGLNNPKISI